MSNRLKKLLIGLTLVLHTIVPLSVGASEVSLEESYNEVTYEEILTNEVEPEEAYEDIPTNEVEPEETYEEIPINEVIPEETYEEIPTNEVSPEETYEEIPINEVESEETYEEMDSDETYIEISALSGHVVRPLGITTGNNIPLRTGPGTGYSIIRSLPNGTNVTILGSSANGNWLRIQAGNNEGWISSNRVIESGRQGLSTGNGIPLRSGPGTGYNIIRSLPNGTNVTILGTSTNGNWFRIRVGNDVGWINSNRILEAGLQGVSTGNDIPLRSGPGTGYGIIRSLPNGTNVTILGTSTNGNWLRIQVGNNIGWINSNRVNVAGIPGVSTGNNIPLRSGPGTGYGIIRSLPNGTNVTILGRSANGNWLRIRVGNDIGWINSNRVNEVMFIRPLARGQVTWEWRGYPGHNGIDLQDVDNLRAPILAAASGIVTRAGMDGALGNRVVIRHNINGRIFYTLYAHMSRIDVRVGDQIAQGQHIGNKGITGNVQSQGHVHFEVHPDRFGNPVNPRNYVNFPARWERW